MRETMKDILIEIERLQSETGISLAVRDPAKYKANMKKIENMNKKLQKAMR